MTLERSSRISGMLQAAYKSATQRMPRSGQERARRDFLRTLGQMPSLLRWLHSHSVSPYEDGLADAGYDRKFWRATLSYGGCSNYCYFTDPDAVEAFIVEKWPEVAVRAVLNS